MLQETPAAGGLPEHPVDCLVDGGWRSVEHLPRAAWVGAACRCTAAMG